MPDVVASLQKQTHMGAAKAVANDQAVAALQQDLASWQARYKRKDAELAAHTSKVTLSARSVKYIVHCSCTTCRQGGGWGGWGGVEGVHAYLLRCMCKLA